MLGVRIRLNSVAFDSRFVNDLIFDMLFFRSVCNFLEIHFCVLKLGFKTNGLVLNLWLA